MPRVKKNAKDVPPPRDPNTVKRGCSSCTSKDLKMTDFPCCDCKDWNYWTDSNPGRNY